MHTTGHALVQEYSVSSRLNNTPVMDAAALTLTRMSLLAGSSRSAALRPVLSLIELLAKAALVGAKMVTFSGMVMLAACNSVSSSSKRM